MNFSLKSLKHSKTFSQETNCFQAVLCLDGKRIGMVANDGHGGSDYVTYNDPAVRERVRSYIKTLPPIQPSAEYIRMGIKDPLPMSESLFFGLMAEEHISKKEQERVDNLNAKRQAKSDAKIIAASKAAGAKPYRILYVSKLDATDVRMAWIGVHSDAQLRNGIAAAVAKLGGAEKWVVTPIPLAA